MGLFDFLKKETITELIHQHAALPPTAETAGPRNRIVGKLESKGIYYDDRSGKWLADNKRLKEDPRLEPLDEEDEST